jgi:asparagine synthase (glutamine-hydrolysing)
MIAGVFDWSGQDANLNLENMAREAGPFPLATWDTCQKPSAALTASKREIREAPACVQDNSRTLIVALDGVLYNRDEFTKSLSLDGHTLGDAELLLLAYRHWGRDLLDHVQGDFAFAIWDGTLRTLFAAVDPFGLRPLYFAANSGRLALASRMSQLRALPWVGSELNDRLIVSFLMDQWRDPFATFYRQIQQLPPGHCIVADEDHATVRRYWRPGEQNVGQATTREEVLQEFADRFRQAVRQRLDPRQPTGILMSGGLDSTAMAGMTAEICRHEPTSVPPLLVISATFGELACDETGYINAVLKRLPFASRKFDGRNGAYGMNDLLQDLRRHEWPALHRQGPLFNGFRDAARGAQILLNGLGGDELTTDYRYYTVPMNGGNPLGILRAAHLVRHVESMSLTKALYLLSRETCPETIKRPYRWLRRQFRPDTPPVWDSWLAPAYRKTAQELASGGTNGRPDCASARSGFGSETLKLAWRILTSPGAAWANRFLVDEFAAVGLECRFPFLDRRLFDLVFSIPASLRPQCRGQPWFKPLISQGLAAYLPPELQRRDAKVDFQSYNCYVFDRCLEFLRPCLFDRDLWQSERFVPRGQALRLFQSYPSVSANGRAGALTKRIITLQNIAGLELWLREIQR